MQFLKGIGVVILVIGVLFTTKSVFAANFTVSERIDSYDASKQTLQITAEIQVTKSGSYQLELDFVRPVDESVKQSKLIHAWPILGKGQADIFTYTIDQVKPGDTILISYRDISGETTATKKITIPANITSSATQPPVVDKPNIDPVVTSSNQQKIGPVDFYFQPTDEYVKVIDDKVYFRGAVRVHEPGTPVKIDLLLGESPSNLQYRNTISYDALPDINLFYEWNISFQELKPNTKYYFTFININNTNPNKQQITDVWSFTSGAGQGDNAGNTSANGTVKNPKSPAIIDNSGEGGVFSYQYPTDIGNPGSITDGLEGSDGPIVPCSSNSFEERCRYKDLMVLVKNIIKFLLIFIIPVIAIVAAYTGIQMIMNRSNPVELSKYKNNLTRIVIGIIVILLAWTLIASILAAVVNEDVRKILLLDLTGL